jgi:hypothetical protein
MKWRDVPENDEAIHAEIPIGELINLNGDQPVLSCCDKADIWFQRVDATPVTDHFYLICKSCGRKSPETDWSYPQAIAMWNVKLWNPEYYKRKPLKIADTIDKYADDLDNLTLADIQAIFKVLKDAPDHLRSLVVEAEANRVEQFMFPEGGEDDDS